MVSHTNPLVLYIEYILQTFQYSIQNIFRFEFCSAVYRICSASKPSVLYIDQKDNLADAGKMLIVKPRLVYTR